MHSTVKSIREVISSEVDFDFDFWVRRFNSGIFWVGAVIATENRMKLLVRILNANGYTTACTGKSGTSGEFIIDVLDYSA